jgi:hypothetical protein
MLKRVFGQWQQALALFGKSLLDGARRVSGHQPGIDDTPNPFIELPIEVIQRRKVASGEERFPQVTNTLFDTTLQESDRLQAIRLVRCDNGIG